MPRELQDTLVRALSTVAQEASRNLLSSRDSGEGNAADAGQKGNPAEGGQSGAGGRAPLSGTKGLLAGAGAAAVAPVALKGARKLISGADGLGNIAKSPGDMLSGAASSLGDRATQELKGKVDEAGGPTGLLKDAVKGALPFGGGGSKGGTPGVGKGRRMPVQQSMDIGLPIETVYNQWTQFEEWPNFMHRVTRVTQEDDCTVSFEAKIWTRKREFTANIETQRPNEQIKWSVSQGLNHTGVVTFHELGPKLTRVLVGFDVQPGGFIEKYARGARYIKRAARADMHRFKAFIETAGQETGAWRGVIEDGELVEEHDPSYDEQRQYADIEELTQQQDQDKDEGDEEEKGRERKSRDSADKRSRQSDSRGRTQSSGRSRSSGGSSRGAGRSSSSRSSGSGRSSGSSRSSGSGRSGSSRSSGAGRSSRSSGRESGGSGSSRTRTRSESRSGSSRSRANGRG
jgi:uncharacterized membrane protein